MLTPATTRVRLGSSLNSRRWIPADHEFPGVGILVIIRHW